MNPSVTGSGATSNVGVLAGRNVGVISTCYVSGGTISGGISANAGGITGLMPDGPGRIRLSYVVGSTVTGGFLGKTGGLVGLQRRNTISLCYVFNSTISGGSGSSGSLIGWQREGGTIIACYAGGKDYTRAVGKYETGGISTIKDTWHQKADPEVRGGHGRTATVLKTPTDYAWPYARWNRDLDGNDETDDNPWDFGTNQQYPVLNIDFNQNNDPADDITRQRSAAGM